MVLGWVCAFAVRIKGVAVRLARGLGVAENLGVGLKFDCGFKGGRFG